jgi:uncharacterized protein YdhG (YjbR/CyaY superfamily)
MGMKKTEKGSGLSIEEKAAMKERLRELKAEANRETATANGERDISEKIAAMTQPDRGICERLHAIIRENAPELTPKTWYGMPAYANADGKVVCFFRDTQKFKERYITLGFNEEAKLDDGKMWPIVFALTELTPGVEAKVADLVRKACR